MDPVALEKAFEIYPDVKIVVLAHLYGTPAKMDELMEVIHRHTLSWWRTLRNLWELHIKAYRPEALEYTTQFLLTEITSLRRKLKNRL